MTTANNNKFKNPEPGEVEKYLESKGIEYFVKGEEIQFPCPHGDCDTNREHPEKKDFHCSINSVTGQYYCVKCNESGNFTTLKRHFGDDKKPTESKRSYASLLRTPEKIAVACHNDMAKDHREYIDYFMKRGIKLYNINSYRLGCYMYNGKMWLTIPIIEGGVCTHLKLRCPPEDENRDPKYKVYPMGADTGVFGGDELLKSTSDSVLICGGELDKIIAEQMNFGMPAISGTAGEPTFKESWIDKYLANRRNVYICFDADDTGRRATEKLAKKLIERCPRMSVFKIVIPESLGNKADLTDANLAGMTAKQLLESAGYIGGAKPIDVSTFQEMGTKELANTLNLTIKCDDVNKVVIFLAMLSTYTEEDQLNIFLNARSSSGKSYIVQEISKLFPEVDIRDFCKISPTAFFYNEDNMIVGDDGVKYLDLSRKILLFYDQMNPQLQVNLRSLLSHDKKKLPFMNTNKGKNGANTATTLYIWGFPSTFFCSANMKMDEQEQTRAFLLSPEITQEKISAGIDLAELKMSDRSAYDEMLKSDASRQSLIDRVYYIKNLNVRHINIPAEFEIAKKFKEMFPRLEPRAQRDIFHLGSLIKAIALLNAPFREMNGNDLTAIQSDVDQAFELWKHLNKSQKYGISPQALDFYNGTILPAYTEKQKSSSASGITIRELNLYNVKNTGTTLNLNFCRDQYIPVLEASGLISCEKNPDNHRETLIIPLDFQTGQSQTDEEDKDKKEDNM
ncbi:toprim domain-containing protein [Candidatus Saccharibacteria bacterium]|nr:toprim domain-containing protein [Candidatus Saccharibacteria bacterium]